MADEDDGYEYSTNVESSIALMRAIDRIHFREHKLPLIIDAIAKSLTDAGVDFSKAKLSGAKLSSEEIDLVAELFH